MDSDRKKEFLKLLIEIFKRFCDSKYKMSTVNFKIFIQTFEKCFGPTQYEDIIIALIKKYDDFFSQDNYTNIPVYDISIDSFFKLIFE